MTPGRMHVVRGAKGASAPREDEDTLRSTQRGEIVDLLGEGVIGGLVNGLKSVYLDGVPVENIDGTRNFPDFGITLTRGGETDESAYSFGETQTEVSVGVVVLAAVPVVRTITDTTADKVRVTITVPTLMETKENGDRVGATFDWAIDVQSAGGGYVTRWTDTVSGKASAPYSRAVVLELGAVGPAPWDVRVRRVTADSTSGNLINAFTWASYTVISGVQMLYRHSAVARLTFDAKNFSSIPMRWYDLVGVSDWDIPVNYDPLARTVSGVWNGTFTQGFTNNPAWVLYNLVKHQRYGLGNYVVQLPDKWTLYQLALWCDVPVPDGRGGTEPRYSINVWVIEQKDALRLLQDICSVFRGVLMHSGATLTTTWDAPGDPVASYAPANVVDGLFTYADGSNGAIRTSCTCWYTDRGQAGKRVPATWDDPDLVTRYGLRSMEIDPLGVSTPGQALRMAKWAVYTAQYENATVTFRVGSEGVVRQVGEVFQITDPGEAGERLGGRIRSATTTQVVLDAPVVLASGQTYTLWVTLPDPADPTRLLHQQRAVTTAAGTVSTLNVSPAFSQAPLADTVWVLEGTDVAPTLWRYVGISEVQGAEGGVEYDVMGVRHVPGKWDLIEADQPLTIPPVRRLRSDVPRVQSMTITETVWNDAAGVPHSTVTVSWVPAIRGLRFVLGWRRDLGTWTYLPPTSANTMDFVDVQPGVYEVQVQSLDARNRLSVGLVEVAVITGAGNEVPNVTGLAYDIKPGQVVARWNRLANSSRYGVELRVGATWAAADFLWAGQSSDYKHARPPNGTYKLWAAHTLVVNGVTTYSPVPVSIDITVDDSIDAGSGGSGTLVLTTSAAPYFTFNSGTTHTSTTPDLVITAQRVGAAVGNIVFTATAYNAASGGTSLGAVTLTGTGDARTLSAAAFVAAGSAGSVRRVDITAAIPGLPSATDSLSIYRSDPTVTTAVLVLSNPRVTIATDVNGNGGDFSTAFTAAGAYVGNGTSAVVDQTASYTFSISADVGVTATINGGAGPVSAAATITVAVSAMTVDQGAVVVSMTPTGGGATTSASFVVTKAPASGTGWTAYFDPPDLTLPVDAAGNVSSFATASSDFYILNAINQLDDTANWAKTITARNVVAELVGDRVNIKQWLQLGTVGASTLASFSLPASWTRAGATVHGDGVFINLGFNSGGAWTVVKRSTDHLAWVDKTVASGAWDVGDYGNGRFLALQVTAVSANALTSTDGGQNWSTYAMPVSAQWKDVRWGGDRWMATRNDSATGYWSATGASGSWTAITLGAGWTLPGFGAGTWVSKDGSDTMRYSINAGTSWATIPGALGPAYIGASFRGRLFLAYGTITTNKILYTEGGGVFKHATLPQNYASPRGLLVVSDVLYLAGTDGKLQYTADGLVWRYAGTITSTGGVLPSRTGSDGVDIDFLPYTDVLSTTTPFLKVALASTSDTVASVRLKGTKPGQEDIERTLLVYKGQAARVVYVASADPSTLYIPATKDGKATDFSAAVATGKVRADGQDVTSLYTISWTASGMTPSSGTGSVVTFTAMADGTDSTLINWVASRPGFDDVTGQTAVVKLKGNEPSGPRKGTNFRGFTSAATSLSLKVQGDGQWALKVGTGPYVVQDAWALPVGSANSSRYVLVTTPPEGAFTSGTVDTFLALTTDREWVYSNSSPGTHRRTFSVVIAADVVGTGAVENLGSFTLIVP